MKQKPAFFMFFYKVFSPLKFGKQRNFLEYWLLYQVFRSKKKNLKNSYCFLEFAFRWFLLFTNQITVYVYLKLFHLILKSNPLNKWLLLRLNFCKNRIQCIYLDRILSNNVFQKTSFFACNHLYSKITMMLKHTPRCVFSIMFSHCYAK